MSATPFKKISAAAVTAALAVAGLSVAHAGPIPPYRTGFNSTAGPTDNPAVGYSQGNLVGQSSNNTNSNVWVDAVPATVGPPATPSTGSLSVVTSTGVTGATAANGDQVVKSVAQGQYAKGSPAVFSDVYSQDTVYGNSKIIAPTSAGGFGGVVDITFDMERLTAANRATGFGVDVFGDGQNSVLASLFLGNNSTDPATQVMLVTDANGIPNDNAGFGGGIDQFNTYHMQLDFVHDTYSVALGSGNPVTYQNAGLVGSGIGGIAFANTNDGTDTAYYDNLQVVPEPAGIAMVGLGTLLLLAKRPKRLA